MAYNSTNSKVSFEESIDGTDKENESQQICNSEREQKEIANDPVEDIFEEAEENSEPVKIAVTRTGRKVNPPKHLSKYEAYCIYCLLAGGNDPETFEEAVKDKEWKSAIAKELNI